MGTGGDKKRIKNGLLEFCSDGEERFYKLLTDYMKRIKFIYLLRILILVIISIYGFKLLIRSKSYTTYFMFII